MASYEAFFIVNGYKCPFIFISDDPNLGINRRSLIYMPSIDLRIVSSFWTYFNGDLYYRKYRFDTHSVNHFTRQIMIYQIDRNSFEFPVMIYYFVPQEQIFQQEQYQQIHGMDYQQNHIEEETESVMSGLTSSESIDKESNENMLFAKEELLMKEFQKLEYEKIIDENLLFAKEEILTREFLKSEQKKILEENLLFAKEEILTRDFLKSEQKKLFYEKEQQKKKFLQERSRQKNIAKKAHLAREYELEKAHLAIIARDHELELARLVKITKDQEIEQAKLAKISKDQEIEQAKLAKIAKEQEIEQAKLDKIAKAEEVKMAKISEKNRQKRLKEESKLVQKAKEIEEEKALEEAIKLASEEREKLPEPKKIIKSVFIEESELKNLIENKSQTFLFAGIKEDTSTFIPVNQQIYIASFFKRFSLNTDFLIPIDEMECTPINETLWSAYDELTFILTKVINLVISVYLLDYETVMIKRNLFKIYYYIIENLVITNLTNKTKELLKIINTVQLMRLDFQKDENPYFRYLDFLFIIYARSYTIVTQTTKGLLQLNQAIIDLSYFLNMKIFNKDNSLNSEILTNINYSDKIFEELLIMANS